MNRIQFELNLQIEELVNIPLIDSPNNACYLIFAISNRQKSTAKTSHHKTVKQKVPIKNHRCEFGLPGGEFNELFKVSPDSKTQLLSDKWLNVDFMIVTSAYTNNHHNSDAKTTSIKEKQKVKSKEISSTPKITVQSAVERRLGSMKLNLTSLVNDSKPKQYQFLLENCKVNAIAKMTIFIKHLNGNGNVGVAGLMMGGEDQQQLQNLYNIPEQTSNQIYHGIRETITRDRSVSPGSVPQLQPPLLTNSPTMTTTNNSGFPLQKSHSLRSRSTKRSTTSGFKSNTNPSNLSLTLPIPPPLPQNSNSNMPISPGSSLASMINGDSSPMNRSSSWNNKLHSSGRSRKNSMSSYNSSMSISGSNSGASSSITKSANGGSGGIFAYNQQHYGVSAPSTPTGTSFLSKQQQQPTLTIASSSSSYPRPHLHSTGLSTLQQQPTSPTGQPTGQHHSILDKTFRFSCDLANIKYEEFTPRECIEDITVYKGLGWKRDELGHLMIDLLKETVGDLNEKRKKKESGRCGCGGEEVPEELYFDGHVDGDGGVDGVVRGENSFEFRDGSHEFHKQGPDGGYRAGNDGSESWNGSGKNRNRVRVRHKKISTTSLDDELLLVDDALLKRYKPLLECEFRDDLKSWHLQC
ncbi:unnamed protein product [Ambrosiozyma monospora]|uniref:Unnamed protein product n=1 Tax=Ambrosiozyma monospora TaxID=43982 RepID=A0A9W7DD52_AMBMO|nr:unnamed protein product [Ambrosiozyma monospora]